MNKLIENLSKKMVAISTVMILAISLTSVVDANSILESATPSLIEKNVNRNSTVSKGASIINNDNTDLDSDIVIQGTGTLSKAENYVDDKLGDVVGFFQSIIKPFTYVMFIISAITILVGVVTGSKHKFAGLLGMAFSVIVYVVVSYSPQIVDYFSNWLIS